MWVKTYDFPELPGSKPLGGSKVNSAFHLFEVDQLITSNSWELNGKKETVSS